MFAVETKKDGLFYVLLVLVCLVVYGQSVNFGYVWDDTLLFLHRNGLQNTELSWDLLAVPVLPGTNYMRPLVFLTFYFEFNLLGRNPAFSHALNVAIFALNVCLIAFVGNNLLRRKNLGDAKRYAGFIAALLYAVHPVNIESTAWLSGRFDLMATLFMLLAVAVFLQEGAMGWIRSLGIAFFMLCAIFSKELGIVLPFVLLSLSIGLKHEAGGNILQVLRQVVVENYRLVIVLTLTVLAYLLVRMLTMDSLHHQSITWNYVWNQIIIGRLPLLALWMYGVLTIFPFNEVGVYHLITDDPTGVRGVVEDVVVVCVLILITVRALRASLSAWLLICALFCIALVIHIIPMTIAGDVVQDRFLTAPLAFMVLAFVATNWESIWQKIKLPVRTQRIVMWVATGGWLAMAFVTTMVVVPTWRNDVTLWRWTKTKFPEVAVVRDNYLGALVSARQYDAVEREVKRIQHKEGALRPAEQLLYAAALISLGNVDGMRYLEGVMEIVPKFHETGDIARAQRFLLSPVQLAGMYVNYSTAKVLFDFDLEGGLKYNDIAQWYLREDEQDFVRYQRAAIYKLLGRVQEAQDILEKLSQRNFYRHEEMLASYHNMVKYFCEKNGKSRACYE